MIVVLISLAAVAPVAELWRASGCDRQCDAASIVVPAETRRRPDQLCFANPYIDRFESPAGKSVNGAMTTVSLSHGSELRSQRLIISVADGEGPGFRDRELCAAQTLLVEGRTWLILARSERPTSGPLEGVLSEMYGSISSIERPSLLFQILFGYATSELVQIEIQSQPVGAELVRGGTVLPFRTNRRFGAPAGWLGTLRVRAAGKDMALSRCRSDRGDGPVTARFLCVFK